MFLIFYVLLVFTVRMITIKSIDSQIHFYQNICILVFDGKKTQKKIDYSIHVYKTKQVLSISVLLYMMHLPILLKV